MGLLDILNGMQNGPRGSTTPGKGGMSPVTMALLGLLAYKAYKGATSQTTPAPPQRDPPPAGTPGASGGLASGGPASSGLGGLLGGLFGGNTAPAASGGMPNWLGPLLAGGAGGTVLADGLRNLISGMSHAGQGQAAQSWVSTGPNKDISTGELAKSIGADDIDALSKQSGLSREELLEGLRTQLPELVDKLTPGGRLPTHEEASRWV
jgi:uncharacterized protein YidB (DUF937 family)